MPGTLKNYKILHTLGYGGSCKVKLGVDMITNKTVAIKMMMDGLNDQWKQLLKNEVAAMGELKHDNIIK